MNENEPKVTLLKPYPFHAWTTAKNKLIKALGPVVKRDSEVEMFQIVAQFFEIYMTEIGQSVTLSDVAKCRSDVDRVRDHYREKAFLSIGLEILRAGAYQKDSSFGSWRDEVTNYRVLVFNGDKITPRGSEGQS